MEGETGGGAGFRLSLTFFLSKCFYDCFEGGRDFTSEKCFGEDITEIPGGGIQAGLGGGGDGRRRERGLLIVIRASGKYSAIEAGGSVPAAKGGISPGCIAFDLKIKTKKILPIFYIIKRYE